MEDSLFYGLGSGKLSEGKPKKELLSIYHLHGAAEWMLYELPDHKDDDPESTIHLFQKQNKTWKLRKTAGEYDLNPYKSYIGLQAGAVQMVPYKSIPWFLTSQWEYGLASLRQADSVIVIGYSFPFHDAVARFAIRTALNTNSRAKILNIDPRAGDKRYQQALIRLLGRGIEFIPKSWCDFN